MKSMRIKIKNIIVSGDNAVVITDIAPTMVVGREVVVYSPTSKKVIDANTGKPIGGYERVLGSGKIISITNKDAKILLQDNHGLSIKGTITIPKRRNALSERYGSATGLYRKNRDLNRSRRLASRQISNNSYVKVVD